MGAPITFVIPAGTAPKPCRGCPASVFWITTEKGRPMPVDADGTSHFATCAAASAFRKAR